MSIADPQLDPRIEDAPERSVMHGAGRPPSTANAVAQPVPPMQALAARNEADVQAVDRGVASVTAQPADPGRTLRRAQLLAERHSWLPPQTTFALASAGGSDNQLIAIADGLRKGVVKGFEQAGIAADDGWKFFTDDPVLQKRASLGLAIKQYLNGVVGPWPIADEHLDHIQAQLQKQGFGQNLQADGQWSPEWNAAYAQWGTQAKQTQLAGKTTGGFTVGHALHVLTAVLPKEAGNAIIGFARNLPHAARQLAADLSMVGGTVAGGVAAPFGANMARVADVTGGFVMGQTPEQYASAAFGQPVNFEGGKIHIPDKGRAFGSIVSRTIDDVGTMLILTDGLKVGGNLSKAVAENVLKQGAVDLTQAEAQQAGGVIARSMAEDAAKRGPQAIARSLASSGIRGVAARGVVGGAAGAIAAQAAGATPAQTGLAAAGGATGAALLGTNAFQNLPYLGRTGGIVGSLADADGLYYKTRSLLATPYRYGAVRVAGQAVSEAGLLGAQARGVAGLSSAINPSEQGSDLSRAVQGEHVMDTVDDAVHKRLGFTVLGAHIAPHLNDLAFLLHGPFHGTEAASARVGARVDDYVQGGIDAMGRVGFDGAIQRGVNAVPGAPNLSRADIVTKLGGEENYRKFFTHQIYDHASYFWAEKNLPEEEARILQGEGITAPQVRAVVAKAGEPWPPVEITPLLRGDITNALAQHARADPAIHVPAARELLAQGGGEQLALRFYRDVTKARMDPNAYLANGKAFMDASDIMSKRILPELAPEAMAAAPGAEEAVKAANLGIAHNETYSIQQARGQIRDFRRELKQLDDRVTGGASRPGGPPDLPPVSDYQDVDRRINEFLHQEFGVDGMQMPHNMAEKLDRATEFSNRLAADVYPAKDASPELLQALQDLHGTGYKLVSGTGIGWQHVPITPLDDLMEGPLTFRRKVIEHLGLNPENTGMALGSHRRLGIRNAIADAVDSGVRLPPYSTPDTMVAYLEQQGVVDTAPNWLKGAIMGAFKPERKLLPAFMEANPELSKGAAQGALRTEITRALELRDVPRKDIIEALTNGRKWAAQAPASAQELERRAAEVGGADILPETMAPVSDHDAEQIYRAIVKGSATPKAYMLGLSRVDDLFRASLGFAGNGVVGRTAAGAVIGGTAGAAGAAITGDPTDILKGAAVGGGVGAVGGERLGWAMANLPNQLVQLRNDFRFAMSPEFDFRRIAKTNVKMAADGVTPTFSPLATMEKAGTLDKDRATLARVLGEDQYADLRSQLVNSVSDDADRMLRSNSIFGFYNARNYEAYYAGQKAAQKVPDDEIRRGLIKVFSYGAGDVEGRSALERSTNFVFFPFSFDKTLYRNLGGYLLDHPGQQILLTKALAAYHDFNEHHLDGSDPLASSWWQKHVPVFQEAERLNAFAHGISAGQPGGINRPLLNLFLPQSWASSPQSLNTLKTFIPAVKDFDRLFSEAMDQGSIMQAAGDDLYRKLRPGPASTPGDPRPTAETSQSQLEQAFAMQRSLFEDYKGVLDHNASTRDKAQQIKFPHSPEWGRWADEPVTKANVREIIHQRYPAYDPIKAATISIQGNADLKAYVESTKGTPTHAYVVAFTDAADKVGTALGNDRYTAAGAAQASAQVRSVATWLAEHDPAFAKIYDKRYKRLFGPLTSVTNG